jgi:AcrR family transcriptional regulator
VQIKRNRRVRSSPFEALPSGPSQLSPEAVVENQRRRILAAAARMAAEHGSAEVTVTQITAYAGVSRATFYAIFGNRHDCLVAAYDEIAKRFVERLLAACEAEKQATAKVSASVAAGLGYLAERPDEARVLILDAPLIDVDLARRTERQFTSILRAVLPCQSTTTELATIGGITSILSNHILAGKAEGIAELAPEVAYLTLLPYAGKDEAERIARSLSAPCGPGMSG